MLAAVAPMLLIAVAITSITRFHLDGQSSWQGAGFGMFATYDNGVSRFLRVEVDGERRDASGVFEDLVERSEVTPLGPAPEQLAEAVRERTDAESVVVEVWGISIDADSGVLRLSIVPIRRVVSS